MVDFHVATTEFQIIPRNFI